MAAPARSRLDQAEPGTNAELRGAVAPVDTHASNTSMHSVSSDSNPPPPGPTNNTLTPTQVSRTQTGNSMHTAASTMPTNAATRTEATSKAVSPLHSSHNPIHQQQQLQDQIRSGSAKNGKNGMSWAQAAAAAAETTAPEFSNELSRNLLPTSNAAAVVHAHTHTVSGVPQNAVISAETIMTPNNTALHTDTQPQPQPQQQQQPMGGVQLHASPEPSEPSATRGSTTDGGRATPPAMGVPGLNSTGISVADKMKHWAQRAADESAAKSTYRSLVNSFKSRSNKSTAAAEHTAGDSSGVFISSQTSPANSVFRTGPKPALSKDNRFGSTPQGTADGSSPRNPYAPFTSEESSDLDSAEFIPMAAAVRKSLEGGDAALSLQTAGSKNSKNSADQSPTTRDFGYLEAAKRQGRQLLRSVGTKVATGDRAQKKLRASLSSAEADEIRKDAEITKRLEAKKTRDSNLDKRDSRMSKLVESATPATSHKKEKVPESVPKVQEDSKRSVSRHSRALGSLDVSKVGCDFVSYSRETSRRLVDEKRKHGVRMNKPSAFEVLESATAAHVNTDQDSWDAGKSPDRDFLGTATPANSGADVADELRQKLAEVSPVETLTTVGGLSTSEGGVRGGRKRHTRRAPWQSREHNWRMRYSESSHDRSSPEKVTREGGMFGASRQNSLSSADTLTNQPENDAGSPVDTDTAPWKCSMENAEYALDGVRNHSRVGSVEQPDTLRQVEDEPNTHRTKLPGKMSRGNTLRKNDLGGSGCGTQRSMRSSVSRGSGRVHNRAMAACADLVGDSEKQHDAGDAAESSALAAVQAESCVLQLQALQDALKASSAQALQDALHASSAVLEYSQQPLDSARGGHSSVLLQGRSGALPAPAGAVAAAAAAVAGGTAAAGGGGANPVQRATPHSATAGSGGPMAPRGGHYGMGVSPYQMPNMHLALPWGAMPGMPMMTPPQAMHPNMHGSNSADIRQQQRLAPAANLRASLGGPADAKHALANSSKGGVRRSLPSTLSQQNSAATGRTSGGKDQSSGTFSKGVPMHVRTRASRTARTADAASRGLRNRSDSSSPSPGAPPTGTQGPHSNAAPGGMHAMHPGAMMNMAGMHGGFMPGPGPLGQGSVGSGPLGLPRVATSTSGGMRRSSQAPVGRNQGSWGLGNVMPPGAAVGVGPQHPSMGVQMGSGPLRSSVRAPSVAGSVTKGHSCVQTTQHKPVQHKMQTHDALMKYMTRNNPFPDSDGAHAGLRNPGGAARHSDVSSVKRSSNAPPKGGCKKPGAGKKVPFR